MRSRLLLGSLILVALLAVGGFAAWWVAAGGSAGAQAAPAAAASPTPTVRSAAEKPRDQPPHDQPPRVQPPRVQPTPAARTAARPTATAAVAAQPGVGSADERDRIVRDATWAPGQLASHFEKHGREGPWASESAYDASARDTVAHGTPFTYRDRESNAERLGFYDRPGNRFTAITRDGRRITTHFRPDRGEAYVRGLARSTYR